MKYVNVCYSPHPPHVGLPTALKIVTTMEDLYMFFFSRILCQISYYMLILIVLIVKMNNLESCQKSWCRLQVALKIVIFLGENFVVTKKLRKPWSMLMFVIPPPPSQGVSSIKDCHNNGRFILLLHNNFPRLVSKSPLQSHFCPEIKIFGN